MKLVIFALLLGLTIVEHVSGDSCGAFGSCPKNLHCRRAHCVYKSPGYQCDNDGECKMLPGGYCVPAKSDEDFGECFYKCAARGEPCMSKKGGCCSDMCNGGHCKCRGNGKSCESNKQCCESNLERGDGNKQKCHDGSCKRLKDLCKKNVRANQECKTAPEDLLVDINCIKGTTPECNDFVTCQSGKCVWKFKSLTDFRSANATADLK